MPRQPEYILLSRFRIRWDLLRNEEVSTLRFAPWQTVLDDFTTRLQRARDKKLKEDEWPPVRRLNSALIALSPQLVHAFEIVPDRSSDYSRVMLALEREGRPQPPTADQMRRVTSEWAVQWAETKFREFFDKAGPAGELLKRLKGGMDELKPSWGHCRVLDLFDDPNDRLRYRAIPSLLAVMLNGKQSQVSGYPVIWRLSQDQAGKLVAVSDPQPSHYEYIAKSGEVVEWHGTFAYVVEFSVHTQAGSNEPWVHLYLSCRRYPDKRIRRFNYGRTVTVMVGTSTPRLDGWSIDPTLVPLTIDTNRGLDGLCWDDRLPALLERLLARPLADPREVLSNPAAYRTPSPATNHDAYLPLYVEGMRPRHALYTGFGVEERAEVFKSVAALLDSVLIPSEPLERDDSTLRASKKALALQSHDVIVEKLSEDESLSDQLARDLQRALGKKPLRLAVCWNSDQTRDAIRDELRRVFALSEDEPFPSCIHVEERHIADELVAPLSLGDLDPRERYNHDRPEDWFETARKQLKKSKLDRISEWKTRVWDKLGHPEAQHATLIELPELGDVHESQSPKPALREAALIGWHSASQFMQPVTLDTGDEEDDADRDEADASRVKSAVADLLFRQTGLLFDTPGNIYQAQAGLPQDIADNLIVIGLCRIRANRTRSRPKRVDYAMAVRVQPDGRVEACLPSETGIKHRWKSYLDATLDVGTIFARSENLALGYEALLTFVRGIILEEAASPTLVMLLADDWRSRVWPQMQNMNLVKQNELDLNCPGLKVNQLPVVEPGDMPNLRVIRLRERGSLGETPQWVATLDGAEWADAQEFKSIGAGAGFEDVDTQGPFFHYLSICDQPQGNKRQNARWHKHERGGRTAFKYQNILEIVPMFLQDGDEPIQWARVPHFIRRSPGWSGGGLVLPYPIHLAQAVINDMLCLLGSD